MTFVSGVPAKPPSTTNFLPELVTLDHILMKTLAPRKEDDTTSSVYEQNLVK
jgi:hypothetical protein